MLYTFYWRYILSGGKGEQLLHAWYKLRSSASTVLSAMMLTALLLFSSAVPDLSDLAQSLPTCKFSKPSADALRAFLALSSVGATEQARSCLVLQLSSKRSTPAGWALAASIFPSRQPALLDHARSLLNEKPNQRSPSSYDVLGPLPMGKNEVDGDPLAAFGGAFAHWIQVHNASRSTRALVASELVPGGHVGWQPVRTGPDGALRVGWQDMQAVWSNLVQALGQRAVLELQAWAIGSLAVVDSGYYELHCKGVHKVMLHDASKVEALPLLISGDIYSAGHAGGGGFGVGHLRAGAYVIAMRVRAVVQAQPTCALVRARAVWTTAPPQLVPDIILPGDGYSTARLCGGLIGLPVKNSGSAGWLRGVSVQSRDAHVTAELVQKDVDLAPGALRLLPIQITLTAAANANVGCPFGTTLELRATADRDVKEGGGGNQLPSDGNQSGGAGAGAGVTLTVRVGGMQCRKPDQSIICTHIDHDGAVSAAAILRPLAAEACDPVHGCPAIVTLHGTSRPVRDSADAYKYKPRGASDSDPYIFGVDRFWVVAPTRHGAHNWEQGGRLAALAALDALAAVAQSHGLSRLPSAAKVDARRVLFSGHSMGGHGAWDAAVHTTSRALGVAAVSGWLRKETYGDSNFLFAQSVNDISTAYVEPALEGVLRASIAENDVELHLPLLRHVPHLARTGDADNTVHSFWARRAHRLLVAAEGTSGALPSADLPSSRSTELTELKGKEHWWWDTARPNDGGAVNDEEMRAFFARTLGPPGSRPQLPQLPSDFLLMSHSPAAFDGRGGWRITQTHQPALMSTVRIRNGSSTTSGELELATRNVRRLLAPREVVLAADGSAVGVRIDGERVLLEGVLESQGDRGPLEFCRLALPTSPSTSPSTSLTTSPSQWRVCDAAWDEAERGPSTAGPMRQAMQSRFAIVPGDGGGDASSAAELERLAVYLGNLFVLTSDASPPIVVDVDARLDGEHNLVLVGGPRENAATRVVADYWASVGHGASWSPGGVLHIGGCALPSSGVGALILGPRPGGGLALVIDGDDTGRRDAVAAGEPTIPPMARSPFSNTLPDYIVTGPTFAAQGFGGLLAAGFFDYRWRVAPSASFLAMDCVSGV